MRMTGLTYLFIGAPSPLSQVLAQAGAAEGADVAVLPETASAEAVKAALSDRSGGLRVIFTPCLDDEVALLEADLANAGSLLEATIADRIDAFLRQMQSVLDAMMRAGSGQIWVCDFDDSFAYHLPMPAAPIQAQARAGAVRSLAKEYSRMGIAVNTILTQPLICPGDDLSAYRAPGLKSYAMRYKPSPASDLFSLLATHAQAERLPFTGACQSLGMGVVQAHLSL